MYWLAGVRPRYPRVPGLFVGVLKDDELELGAGQARPASLGETRHLSLQHLARGDGDRFAVDGLDVGEDDGRLLVPRDETNVEKIWGEGEVAVAALPRRQRKAAHRVHVDVGSEEVTAALDDAVEQVVHEESCVDALALKATLHVGNGENDRVDVTTVHAREQLITRQSPWR